MYKITKLFILALIILQAAALTSAHGVESSPDTLFNDPLTGLFPLEVKEQRTATTKVYLNADGTYTSKLYPTPIHAKEDGQWIAINPKIKPSATSGYENTAGRFKVRFGAKAKATTLTSFEYENYKVS